MANRPSGFRNFLGRVGDRFVWGNNYNPSTGQWSATPGQVIGGIGSRALNFVLPGAGTVANTIGNAYHGSGPLGGLFNRTQPGAPSGVVTPGQFMPFNPPSPGVSMPQYQYNPMDAMVQQQIQQGQSGLDARMNSVQQGLQNQINAIQPAAQQAMAPSSYSRMRGAGLGFGGSGGGSVSLAQLNDMLTLQSMTPFKTH